MQDIETIIDLDRYPIQDLEGFASACRRTLQEQGALMLTDFVRPDALQTMRDEAYRNKSGAYFCQQSHTAYLSAPDANFADDHPRNVLVTSTKGCITDDQVPVSSPLRALYSSAAFQRFLCTVLEEEALYPYADTLSSINVHYYEQGQELGWHFDNSSFSTTLMLQAPETGGELEYVKNLRNADKNEMNFDGVGDVLNGQTDVEQLRFEDGTLALFRGRNTLHRVAPVTSEKERIQVVLAYNTEPGISLAEEARMTFYGRTH